MGKPKTNRVAGTSGSPRSKPAKMGAGRAFWRYSLRLYRRPNVAAACLRLQDRHRLNVNILLLCGFAARSGHSPLSRHQIAAADAAIRAWSGDVVEPLRQVRRTLKIGWHSSFAENALLLRPKVAALELAAEKAVQLALGDWLATQPRSAASVSVGVCALRNLESYSLAAKPALDRRGRRDLRLLAAAMC